MASAEPLLLYSFPIGIRELANNITHMTLCLSVTLISLWVASDHKLRFESDTKLVRGDIKQCKVTQSHQTSKIRVVKKVN